MGRLSGKVAIITGAARGMGASHARVLAREGAKVVITDILESEGQALAQEIGGQALFVRHDVTSQTGWDAVVEEAERVFGHVNVLVNNAGMGIPKSIEEMEESEYRKVIDINQVGVFLGMKSVLQSMKKAQGGSIINISSLSGFAGSRDQIAYDASKFAVRGMTKTAAVEFSDYGIRVNSVHPGIVQTPILQTEGAEEIIKELEKGIPLKRIAKPEDVSNLILYLASDESSYSTGSEFTVDGGMMAKL